MKVFINIVPSVFATTLAISPVNANNRTLEAVLENYDTICLQDYNADLDISKDAVYELKAGDDQIETVTVVDTSGLNCGAYPIGLCGSGGCEIKLLVGNKVYTERGWAPINVQYNNHYLIVLPLSGGRCGAFANISPCFKVLAWDSSESTFLSPR